MSIAATTGKTASNATAGASLAFAATALVSGQYLVFAIALADTTKSVSSITGVTSATPVLQVAQNGTGVRVEIWTVTVAATSSQTITLNFSGSTLAAACFEEYSGLSALGTIGGTATGSNTYAVSAGITTEDANNWLVGVIGFVCNSGNTFTAFQGTIRQSVVPALTSVGVALVDLTCPGQVTAALSARLSASHNWATAGLELRSSANGDGTYLDYTGYLPVAGNPLDKDMLWYATEPDPVANVPLYPRTGFNGGFNG